MFLFFGFKLLQEAKAFSTYSGDMPEMIFFKILNTMSLSRGIFNSITDKNNATAL